MTLSKIRKRFGSHLKRFRIGAASVLALGTVALTSCRNNALSISEGVIHKAEALDTVYLEGRPEDARSALYDEIALLEGSSVVQPRRQAAALFVTCARLFVLEKRLNNERAAEFALIKVKYWNLRRYELDGPMSQSKVEEFSSVTPDSIVKMVAHADKALTNGRGPMYQRSSPPASEKGVTNS
jgi:hypothetical protein